MFQMDGEHSNEMSFQAQPYFNMMSTQSPFDTQTQNDENFKNEASSLEDQEGKMLGPNAFES